MRYLLTAALASVVLAGTLPGQDRQRPRRLPDQWISLDSLIARVAITDDQRAEVEKHYNKLNEIMGKAAEERRKMFQEMRSSGQRPTPEQRQAMRAKFEFFQTDIDKEYKAVRKLLTEEQQAVYDSLPKPRVMPQRQRRRP